MPNFTRDDEDCPDCNDMFRCARHSAPSDRAREARKADSRARGIDPDAIVSGELAAIVLTVNLASCLSEDQKEAIERILFPYPRKP